MAKTQIFETYSDFLKREDKSLNGVSPEHAEKHPDWESDNETNRGCWNCSDCSDCSHCSRCSYCSYCSYCSRCSDCSRCSRCSDCSDCSHCSYCSDCSYCSYCSRCSRCSDCSDCSYCSYCSRCSDKNGKDRTEQRPITPKVADLDAKVYAAASQPESLDMSDWHSCENTHCRAGWIVTLAGEEGAALEDYFDTPLAAMMIYEESTEGKINPCRFFDSNEDALVDMAKCAGLDNE